MKNKYLFLAIAINMILAILATIKSYDSKCDLRHYGDNMVISSKATIQPSAHWDSIPILRFDSILR